MIYPEYILETWIYFLNELLCLFDLVEFDEAGIQISVEMVIPLINCKCPSEESQCFCILTHKISFDS